MKSLVPTWNGSNLELRQGGNTNLNRNQITLYGIHIKYKMGISYIG